MDSIFIRILHIAVTVRKFIDRFGLSHKRSCGHNSDKEENYVQISFHIIYLFFSYEWKSIVWAFSSSSSTLTTDMSTFFVSRKNLLLRRIKRNNGKEGVEANGTKFDNPILGTKKRNDWIELNEEEDDKWTAKKSKEQAEKNTEVTNGNETFGGILELYAVKLLYFCRIIYIYI